MDYFTKKRLVIWGFVILIIMNLTDIATIGYYRFFRSPVKVEYRKYYRKGRCPIEEIDMTDNQIDQLKNIRHAFNTKSEKVVKDLQQKRMSIIAELSKEEPDTAELNKLAEEMGELHAALKKETIAHLLKLKQTLSSEQHKKFIGMYHTMFEKRGYGSHRHGNGDKPHGKRQYKYIIYLS